MKQALEHWHAPDAAQFIAEKILFMMHLMGKCQTLPGSGNGGAGAGFRSVQSAIV
jgi:hypothetical protein